MTAHLRRLANVQRCIQTARTLAALAGKYEVNVRAQIDRQSWWADWCTEVIKLRLPILGTGFFSCAVKLPYTNEDGDHYVVKVGFKAGTDYGLHYAMWCRDNQGKPCVPEVHDLKVSGNVFTVLTKQYQPMEEYYEEQHAIYGKLWSCLEDGMEPTTPEEQVAYDIGQHFTGVCRLDFHAGNIMFDGDKPIITDPVSEEYKDGYTYEVSSEEETAGDLDSCAPAVHQPGPARAGIPHGLATYLHGSKAGHLGVQRARPNFNWYQPRELLR